MAGRPIFDAFIRLRADGGTLADEVKDETKRALDGAVPAAAVAGKRVGDRYGQAVGQAAAAHMRTAGEEAGERLGDGVTRGVDGRLRDARGRFLRAGEQAGDAVADGATRQIESSGGRFSNALSRAFSGARGRLQAMGSWIGGALRTGIAASAVAAGVGFVAALRQGITGAASKEQSLIGMDTLLPGGMDVAEKFYAELTRFSANTPFELPGLVDNARALLGVGESAKKVLPDLTSLGNASSALGLDQERFGRVILATTQAMSKGKVQAEELMQMTEAGIPIWPLLSRALGKPVPELQKLATKGKLLAKDVFPALFKQMNKDYGGAMERQGKTLSGVWSTFKDNISLALTDAVQPLVPYLKEYLPKAGAAAARGIDLFVRGVKRLSDVLGPLVEKGKDFTSRFLERLVPGGFDGAVKRVKKGMEEIRKGWDSVGAPAKRPPAPAVGQGNPNVLAARDQGSTFGTPTALFAANDVGRAEDFGASLKKVMDGLSRAGESVSRVFGRLGSIWAGIAERVGPNLADLGSTLADTWSILTSKLEGSSGAFAAIGEIAQSVLVPVLSFMANSVLVGLRIGFETLNVILLQVKAVVDGVVMPAIRTMISVIMGALGGIVDGAAKAFGWVPGLGPKLETAAEEFRKFKDRVNSELDGIDDEVVDVNVNLQSNSNALAAIAKAKAAASIRLGGGGGKPKPGRAGGGGVLPGRSYWVGEFGPERFTPGQPGTITPATHALGGGRDVRRLVGLMERLVSAVERGGGRGDVLSALDRALGARLV